MSSYSLPVCLPSMAVNPTVLNTKIMGFLASLKQYRNPEENLEGGDSDVDTSNDSNDDVTAGVMITPPPPVMPPPVMPPPVMPPPVMPPPVMPPTPTSSPNTHEWPNINPNAFHLNSDDLFAVSHLPPLPLNNSSTASSSKYLPSIIRPSTLPSCSYGFKMRPRTCTKSRLRSSYNNIFAESTARKLRFAASTNNMELLTRSLESGADPNDADELKRSPLHLATCRGHFEIVRELLKFGANPNVVDSLGNTPLHLAVISSSSNNIYFIVYVLVQGGASVHMFDRGGNSPLDLAEGKLRILRTYYEEPTLEDSKILEDMIALMLRYMVKEKQEVDNVSALEKCMQNLSTSDDQGRIRVVNAFRQGLDARYGDHANTSLAEVLRKQTSLSKRLSETSSMEYADNIPDELKLPEIDVERLSSHSHTETAV
uniref:ANK_REP_REGION domain-containing protein n=1 Tax=Glossina brevipalpis TaxID=37001 RepID=A0A1A9WYB4_9MUSC